MKKRYFNVVMQCGLSISTRYTMNWGAVVLDKDSLLRHLCHNATIKPTVYVNILVQGTKQLYICK